MAANIQQMGAAGALRRPPQQQLSQVIYAQLMTQSVPTTGWHAVVSANMRLGHAMNIITNSFLAMPSADSTQVISLGLTYERDAFTTSPDKSTYEQRVLQRVNDLFRKRQQNEQTLHHGLSAQAAAQAQAQAQNQAQMMMNQSLQMRGMAQPLQQGLQNFQPMQQSPINQQNQPNLGVNNPNNLSMNPNQQAMHNGGQMRQMGMQAGMANLSAQEQTRARQLAIAKFNTLTEPVRGQYRTTVVTKLGPHVVAQLQQEGIDPLLYFYQSQFHVQMSASKGQPGVGQPGMPMQGHQQRPMNQPGQQHPAGQNGEFGPFANVESIMNQQKAGLMAQEAGQMVVPASNGAGRNATPQPLGSVPNANQGIGQPALPHQLPQQFNGHQPAQQQIKMDQRAAQTQAQIRAQAQAKQMQGQPGGLNGPGGASQSPAMNTLNAPVNRMPMGVIQGDGHPQMGQGNVPFRQQMMDPRFNQTGQRTPMGPNANMNRNAMLHNILAQMPADIRQQIMSLPQEKMPEMIMKWHNTRNGQTPGRPQPQMGQAGSGNPIAQSMTQFAPGNNNLGQHQNLGLPMNQQNQLMMQQQINQIRNPNAPQGPMDRNILMDNMVVPPKILEQLRLTPQGAASPEVKKWGQLKQWLAQKNFPQNGIQNLLNVQNAQFQSYVKANPALVAAANSQPPQPNQPQQGIQPRGQPNPQMGQPMPNMPSAIPANAVTATELQAAKKYEKFKGWPDDRIRMVLFQMKMQALKGRVAGQVPGQPAQGTQVSQPSQAGTVPAMQSANGPAVPQKQQNTGPETSTASPVGQARNIKQPQTNQGASNVAAAPTAKTGTKRPMPDETTEGHNPSRTPAQRPQSQQLHTTQIPHLTHEQLASMPAEQRQKYEAMVKSRQSAAPAPAPEEVQRLKAIGQEQHIVAMKEQLPDIPMTPEQYQDMAQRVQATCGEMNKISRILTRWYSMTRDDARAKLFFKLRTRLVRQYADGDKMSVLRDKFSITSADLDSIKGLLESFVKDLSIHFPALMKKTPSHQNASEQAGPQGAQTLPGAPATQPTPLNAANLEKQQAFMKMHQRNNSKAGQPPAAPTTAQPPFPFGAQSPDGQPKYAGQPAVTQDSLQLPARKRPKTESKAGAGPNQNGSSANASPQVQKLSSPEISKRQAASEARPAPQFTCSDQYCESRNIGFPTEDALRKHMDEEHIKPAEDPMKFAVDGLAEVLGLDANGKAKKSPTTSGNVRSPVDASKHNQNSNSRDAPMNRQGSTAGPKSNELSKTIAGKVGTPKPDLGSKIVDGITPAFVAHAGAVSQAVVGELTGTTIDPQELLSGVTGFEMGGDGAILDMNLYRAITPNDTPESIKDSASSEPNSDVSEGVALNVTLDMGFSSWEPFAPGHESMNMDLGNADQFAALPYSGFMWEDVNPDFDKPFVPDTSFFLLDTT